MFIENEKDIINSVIEFNSKPEYWRNILGGNPIYFVHVIHNGKCLFGLSKFCAFKNLSSEEYISEYRFMTDGNRTQTHISKVTEIQWQQNHTVLVEFEKWIKTFFPKFKVERARFISIKSNSKVIPKKNNAITPEKLKEKLDHQLLIGKIGEKIAYDFECRRLKDIGVKEPKKHITCVSSINCFCRL